MFSDKNDKDVNSSLIRLLIYHLRYIRFLYCMFPFQIAVSSIYPSFGRSPSLHYSDLLLY